MAAVEIAIAIGQQSLELAECQFVECKGAHPFTNILLTKPPAARTSPN